ncbi:MAG: hypothetical protein H6926_03045 [Chromatiales bacterium]|nr:hypothetical protein [Gammaproteobacteria bacterium]MCP5352151.1 hypothetical protein [Chromatiales bacterium]
MSKFRSIPDISTVGGRKPAITRRYGTELDLDADPPITRRFTDLRDQLPPERIAQECKSNAICPRLPQHVDDEALTQTVSNESTLKATACIPAPWERCDAHRSPQPMFLLTGTDSRTNRRSPCPPPPIRVSKKKAPNRAFF